MPSSSASRRPRTLRGLCASMLIHEARNPRSPMLQPLSRRVARLGPATCRSSTPPSRSKKEKSRRNRGLCLCGCPPGSSRLCSPCQLRGHKSRTAGPGHHDPVFGTVRPLMTKGRPFRFKVVGALQIGFIQRIGAPPTLPGPDVPPRWRRPYVKAGGRAQCCGRGTTHLGRPSLEGAYKEQKSGTDSIPVFRPHPDRVGDPCPGG